MKTAQDFLDECPVRWISSGDKREIIMGEDILFEERAILKAMIEFGKQEFNRALDLAAEKAQYGRIIVKNPGENNGVSSVMGVDKKSILNLKTP